MSPRNRTPDKDSTENSTAVADNPGAEAASAVADRPLIEGGENAPGFAERVGEKNYKPLPDPFGIAADYLAGVRLMENKKERVMAIQFGDGSADSKPSPEVLEMVKAAGYRWNPSERLWTHPIRYETAMSTRIEADRLYQGVCQQIRQEKGLGGEEKTPF
jgi:hypothetical protein